MLATLKTDMDKGVKIALVAFVYFALNIFSRLSISLKLMTGSQLVKNYI